MKCSSGINCLRAHTLLISFAALMLTAAGFATIAKGEAAHLLPQAVPGSVYAAQLVIPPGLGYPFQHCELLGQVPRWLTLDCARLQLRGRVPASRSIHADYQVTLRIEDGTGNTLSFPLTLKVSANPQVVNLADHSSLRSPLASGAGHGGLSDPSASKVGDEKSQSPEGQSSPLPTKPTEKNVETGSALTAPPTDQTGHAAAAQLNDAVAQLRHAEASTTSNCSPDVPTASDGPVVQESAAITDLKATYADCAAAKNPACAVSIAKLNKSAADAQLSTAACAKGGTASGGVAISTKAAAWYKTRSDLWDQMSKVVTVQASAKDPSASHLPDDLVKDLENPAAAPTSSPAGGESNLGLTRYYFLGGSLLSQQQDQFSHSDLFLGFHLDRVLRAPERYLSPIGGKPGDKPRYLIPGVSNLLDIRLTSLPVSVQPCTPSTAPTSKSCSNTATGSTAATTTDQTQVFLNSQKAARFEGGIYLPYQLRRWQPSGATDGYVVNFAPIAKIGFDTGLNGLNQTQQSSNAPATVQPTGNSNTFYKFYEYGGRLVWNEIDKNTTNPNDAPALVGYIDVGLGRFSNMATLLCPHSQACVTSPSLNHQFQYRLSLEGLLDIPGAAGLSIGFIANLGQRTIGAHHYDLLPPDDLRFLFGYKIDPAKFFKKPSGF